MTEYRRILSFCMGTMVAACSTSGDSDVGEDASSSTSDAGGDAGSSTSDAGGGPDSSTSGGDASSIDCAAEDSAGLAACAVEAFLATLSSEDQETVTYDFTDSVNKTCWSNLPGQDRPGITFGELSTESRAAAMAVAAAVLSDDGYEDLRGVLAADDYLGEQSSGGGGGPGGMFSYTSDNAHIAVFGTPSGTGDWMLSLGNHHMAYNITFTSGTGYPTPNHLGAEPRGEFTVNSETFGPLVSEGDAMSALFDALSESELSAAHLSGTFGDILLGPDEYCTGSYDNVVFPTGSDRGGVLVSDLSTEQQALVTAAISEWVADYRSGIADSLIGDYTSEEAYQDTYVAWGGSSTTPDVTVNGTYFRIDGPRVWIEVACQNGVILSGTHYHTIYRDRDYDYGAEL